MVLIFGEKLEIDSERAVPTELDQEQLMIAVNKTVKRYSLHSLSYLLGIDKKMKNLFEKPQSFTLEDHIS